ncbi:hypothetical protein UlMin_007221 [Ulmus minor]
MEETTESTTGYSHEPIENSGTCTVNIDSDRCTANAEEDEIAPADVSSYDWLSIVDMLGLQKHPAELVPFDVVGKELPLLEMWECFYTTYSRSIGFGIRIHTTSSNESRGVWRREWVCARQGFRREKFLSPADHKWKQRDCTRCGCTACLHVLKSMSGTSWKVQRFDTNHNHVLVAQEHLQFLRSNHKVTSSQASQVRTYKYAGLRTCDIVNLMVQYAGGFERLGFTRKDAYNKVAAMHRAETVETDSEGLLGYLASKIDSTDPTLYAKYAIDEEDRLCHIFYNAFNKPLVMFVGMNNHFWTCVFGFVLLLNEKIESYKWVLETFLDCMHRRKPTVVVTDGDAAMKAAIILCFPDFTHRLCGWHLSTNATSNIKSPDFTKAFRKLLYSYFNVPQWYERWDALLDKFELHDNAWAATTYEQRLCESINSYIKRFLNCKIPLRDFIRHVDIAQRNIRESERHDDFISYYTEPAYPTDATLIGYLRQYGAACTRQVFHMVKLEVDLESRYNIVGREAEGTSNIFKLRKSNHQGSEYTVTHAMVDNHLECSYRQFESDGIPCRHIFAVMKNLDLQHIPPTLIKKRFTVRAKEGVTDFVVPPSYQDVPQVIEMSRFGTLNSLATHMNSLAAKLDSSYNIAKDKMRELILQFQLALEEQQDPASSDIPNERSSTSRRLVRDPIIIRTKGCRDSYFSEPGVQRQVGNKCGRCGVWGHYRTTCRAPMEQDSHATTQGYETASHTNATPSTSGNNQPFPGSI